MKKAIKVIFGVWVANYVLYGFSDVFKNNVKGLKAAKTGELSKDEVEWDLVPVLTYRNFKEAIQEIKDYEG